MQETYGEAFNPAKITRDDVQAYLKHLSKVRKTKPATTNRKAACPPQVGRRFPRFADGR